MLKLILGTGGSGRTTHIMQMIKQQAQNGQKSILLVPEQFSQTSEMQCYNTLKDELNSYCTVASFRTLAQRINAFYGGEAAPSLTDAGRVVFVRRALNALGEQLTQFKNQSRSTAFCKMCAEIIKELKTAGATGARLAEISKQMGVGGAKLYEISLIFSAYEAAIGGTALDETDRVTIAAQNADEKYFGELTVYIDNFDGFTAPEYKMLSKIISCAGGCVVSLCTDSLSDSQDGLGVFSPVKKTAARLINMAKKNDIKTEPPVILQKCMRTKARGLINVNQFIAFGECEDSSSTGVTVSKYTGAFEEAKHTAAKINALAKSGVRYSKMAIICRDMEMYKTALEYELGLMGVPFFIDGSFTAEHSAPCVFIRSALAVLKDGINTENILALLKTGLCGESDNDIAALDNYAYTWQPSGGAWKSEFTQNPSGINGGAKMQPFEMQLLESAEKVRKRTVKKLDTFIKNGKGLSGSGLCRHIYLLMTQFGAPQNAAALAETLLNQGEVLQADAALKMWDLVIDMLDEMSLLLGQDAVSAAEFDELFLLLVRAGEISGAPQTVDSVIITTADRMRLSDIDYAFVLGVNEGVFPMAVGYSGLLNHTDREQLVECGIEMPGAFENRLLLEQMFFYRALTCAGKELNISYLTQDGGSAKAISTQLAEICDEINPPKMEVDFAQLCATALAAADMLSCEYRQNVPSTASLKNALQKCGEVNAQLAAMQKARYSRDFKIKNSGIIKELLSDTLRLSPSKIDRYYSCGFSYFLEYVLKVSVRKKAELSPMESGTFIHYVLENTLRECGDRLCDIEDEQLAQLSAKYADKYIEENMQGLLGERFSYLAQRLKQRVADLLCYIKTEQQQASFHPCKLELEIGENKDVEPLILKTENGETIKVTGKIDRLDTMCRENKTYIRVVDYKTGSKAFNLEDIYCGLNIQMLVYLFTVCKNAEGLFKNPTAAGVLYLASDPAPQSSDERTAEEKTPYKVDGLVLDDEIVINAMDKGISGIYVPVSTMKNGGFSKRSKIASAQRLGSIERHIEKLIIEMAALLYSGEIKAKPLLNKSGHSPCEYCNYITVCRHEAGINEAVVSMPENAFDEEGQVQ